ncbi:MAG TPA: hypothetical protein VFB28_02855 [Terriglobales bacterium]|nr:hypothetical protein [Terriglobales bacterium]
MKPTALLPAIILLGVIASAQSGTTLPPTMPSSGVGSPDSSAAPPIEANPNAGGSDTAAAISLPDLLPKPEGNATLVGGTVRKVDLVRDQLMLQVYGGGNQRILFDDRTHFYRDDAQGSIKDLATGERVYVDTVLAGTDIFARNIRVVTSHAVGQSNGQVVRYDAGSGELTVTDTLSPHPVRMHLSPSTTFVHDNHPASASELQPGTLVALTFGPENGGHDVVHQVTILAEPGSTFTFIGRISYLDVHRGRLVVVDPRDQKSYDVQFDPASLKGLSDDLREGMDVTVITSFDGNAYIANSITINHNPTP